MKRETKTMFANTRPGTLMHEKAVSYHSLGRGFRRSLSELDKHPLERRIHGEVPDPAKKKESRPERPKTIVHRAAGIERRALARPVRFGKTKKDKGSGSWASRFANRAARVEWQQDNRATNGTFPGGNK